MPMRTALNETLTRDSLRDTGETVREFDLRSAAIVLGSVIGALFLVFYLLAFVPWLLANGMTAAVEGMMHQVGFDSFSAKTLGDWILVLFIGAVFTAFIVAIVLAILALYNTFSQRTGMGLRIAGELGPAEEPIAIEAARAKPAKRTAAAKKSGATKRTSVTKQSGTAKRATATKRRA